MKRGTDEQRRRVCQRCAAIFFVKPYRRAVYCSRECKDMAQWKRRPNDPRPCAVCGTTFTPSRGHGDAKHCSRPCTWVATKGPEYNAKIARDSRDVRAAAQRDRGEKKTYRKLHGRHEHRTVAELLIGRPLAPGEVVHHKDGDHRNNDPSNLAVMTQAEHMREHGLGIPGKSRLHTNLGKNGGQHEH